MALLGQLDPRQQQAEQNRTRSMQSLQAEAELTKLLRDAGQNTGHQQFTSPWQVAGQWANALAGRSKANDLAGGYAALNESRAPGGGAADASLPAAASAPAGQSSAAPAASAGPSQGSQLQPGFKGSRPSPEIQQAIKEGSEAAGIPPQIMATFAHIESDFNPLAHDRGHSYYGLMQLSPEEMKRVSGGQGNVFNAKDSVMAAAKIAHENFATFQKATGRQPDASDLYGMHQQGAAGWLQHLSNPDAPAWQNMANTAEGRQKGTKWAQSTITGNGGNLGMTSGQFVQHWRDRFGRAAQGDHNAFADSGPIPQTSPLVEHGNFVPPELLRNPAPTYTMQQLQALARTGQLGPDQIQKFNAEIQSANQPKSVPFAGGQVTYDPRTGQQVYLPQIQNKPVKVGDIETQMPYWVDSKGQMHHMGGQSTSPSPASGGGISGSSAPASLGQAIQSGDIDQLSRAGIQRAGQLEESKKGAEQAATSMAAAARGARGLGLTGRKVEALTNDLIDLVSDPAWSQGGGMAGTRQALSRLSSSLGLDPDAATARGVLNQAAAQLKLYGMEALKTNTSELGEQAGRVFEPEVETLSQSQITGDESQKELIAKLRNMNRVGRHLGEGADKVDEYLGQRGGKPDSGIYKLLREHEAAFHMLTGRESTGAAPQRRGSADMPLPAMPGGTTPNGVKWKLVQ